MKTRLYLAPMEGLGERPFRRAMARVGGFDEATASFLRVPRNAHVPSLAVRYEATEMAPYPMAVQLMGENPELMAEMARAVEHRGAHRIDLNCGCPSNTVTGRGAGSSLLQTPDKLHAIAKAMVEAVAVPVSVKIRSGYADTSRFEEILDAVEEAGAAHLCLHPRTKVEGYGPPVRWELIAQAKERLSIPVVGSGDVVTPQDAERMVRETRCDGVMIGRGSIMNPWIFHQIRDPNYVPGVGARAKFLLNYLSEVDPETKERSRLNACKGLISQMFKYTPVLMARRMELLRRRDSTAESFVQATISLLEEVENNHPDAYNLVPTLNVESVS